MAHILNDSAALFCVPLDVPTGWECPRCKHVYAPLTTECFRCAPPPVLTAPFLPRPKAETCCICGSPGVTYRNYLEQPFCGPCANGDRLSIRLPEHMAGENAVQVAPVTGTWREVFPGLQAQLRTARQGHADVEFRLTPEDGHDHA